jgi:hypothetical protein
MTRSTQLSRIHLDLVGGISGDMFVSALCDAFPDEAKALLDTLVALDVPAHLTIGIRPASSNAVVGTRFLVTETAQNTNDAVLSNADQRIHAHDHRLWRDIRLWIRQTSLPENVKQHCIQMFTLLAEAEASIHGVDSDTVEFHEVGAWDSIVDFIAAAWLIDRLSPASWSYSEIPLGSGVIQTQHGLLPVPAPATAMLLKGFAVRQDTGVGERVTPTGAAILRYLKKISTAESESIRLETLVGTGIGVGTRAFFDIPNILRCLAFESKPGNDQTISDHILLIQFEVDDQSPEDLACGLDYLRESPGVHEVFQSAIYGKKNRLTMRIDVIAEPQYQDSIVEQCFSETTTIGLRWRIERRQILHREAVVLKGSNMRGKLVTRPKAQPTCKVEMDDLRGISGFIGREQARVNFEKKRRKESGE